MEEEEVDKDDKLLPKITLKRMLTLPEMLINRRIVTILLMKDSPTAWYDITGNTDEDKMNKLLTKKSIGGCK